MSPDLRERPTPPGWYLIGALALVIILCVVLLAVSGCAPGDAGEVCTEPDLADCPSDAGGETTP